MKRLAVFSGVAACLLLIAGGEARAGRLLTAMGEDGGGGVSINLIVREVKVSPVWAHVGDKIRIDAVIENRGEGAGTITARVYANGKSVASRLFTYDPADGPGALYRESFIWDTKDVAPGQYRIRAEAFDWNDSSPFDNDLAVKEPVTLLPAGTAFPAGQPGGGEAVAADPRWRPERPPPGSGSRNSPGSSGIVGKTASGRRQ